MANPQKENGYVPIANELIENLVKTTLLGSEFRVLFFFIRKTYGFNKKEDKISLTQFEKGTRLSRPTVVKTLKNLVVKNILVKTAKLVYSLNKDWEKWIVNTALLVKHNDKGSKTRLTTIGKHGLTKTSKHGLTHKRHKDILKDNIQKTSKSPPEILLGNQWNELIDPFQKVNPMWRKFYSSKTERHALQDLVKEMGFEKVKWLIGHLKEAVSKPYAPKITKPTELRRDIGKLIVFWEQEKQKNIKSNTKVGKL